MPNRTEVVTVIVEAHASGRLRFGTQGNQQLKLQRLFQLAQRSQPAGSSEERVISRSDPVRKAEKTCQQLRLRHPSSSKLQNPFGCAHANELAHSKGLEPPKLVRGFA